MKRAYMTANMKSYFPIFDWGKQYNRDTLTRDLVAAVIVTIMLIPQSLAYALLAGLPAEAGLYASILPLLAYGLFGTSCSLAVGPVAVISLMTASAVTGLDLPTMEQKWLAATLLALTSGAMLLVLGFLRLGFIANFLSHPVIAGFITATGIIIAFSQLKHILGIPLEGDNLIEISVGLVHDASNAHKPTIFMGIIATLFLFWVRKGLQPFLLKLGLSVQSADILAKTGPIFAVVITTLAAYVFKLGENGMALVGDVPNALPSLGVPSVNMDFLEPLIMPALLISIIGFVESISVAQTLAAKKRQRIEPDQELIALGASNVASGVSMGFPVTGGFSRSVVNYDAGARTPAAGIFTAVGIALATVFLTPLLAYLPKATLAATIIVAVTSLIDFSIIKRTWHYSKPDFIAVITTIALTLLFGVEVGVSAGVFVSILIFLLKTSRPHVAVVGLVEGTQHYRNIDRHHVITHESILSLRVDESLYFANARYLEDAIYKKVTDNQELKDVVLLCSAVNDIDMSALESLEAINQRLSSSGVKLHLSEVKGPVMDKLDRENFSQHLSGNVYLDHHLAMCDLAPPPEYSL